MKAFLLWLVLGASSSFAQLNFDDGTNDENRTETPTTSAPTPVPPPTPFPTPEGPFEYMAWGESNFGYHYQDLYYWGYQHAIRRPGWSWNEPLTGYAPFCYNQTCYTVSSACTTLGGTLLHESYCSFPEDVKIAGPSCWNGECTATGRDTCGSVGGITIGDSKVEWCLFRGDRTIFGPACYNEECYEAELEAGCNNLNGRVWNKHYCILPDYYTVIGPVCWRAACFASTENDCKAIGGTNVAKWWCLVKGCDKTVIGPTCSMVPEGMQEQCFEADTITACNAVGGSLFAQRFCVIDGTDWTMIGPNAWEDTEQINQSRRFCRELKDDIGPPFAELESYDIGGRFCLVKKRLPPIGPYCQGNTCYPENSTALCTANGGEADGPFMCALPPEYRRAEGPLMWNGEILPSSAPECNGGFFCAIPEIDPPPEKNLRCPTAALGSSTKPPSTDPDGSSHAALTRGNLSVVLGLVSLAVSLW